eukprot:COSAG01_NODE_57885_length_309_cov_1.176190_1_plen_94_part_10
MVPTTRSVAGRKGAGMFARTRSRFSGSRAQRGGRPPAVVVNLDTSPRPCPHFRLGLGLGLGRGVCRGCRRSAAGLELVRTHGQKQLRAATSPGR